MVLCGHVGRVVLWSSVVMCEVMWAVLSCVVLCGHVGAWLWCVVMSSRVFMCKVMWGRVAVVMCAVWSVVVGSRGCVVVGGVW